jgi:ketosteroid isomerase-like protein
VVDNTEVVRQAYERFAAGDVPGLLGMMNPKIEWFEAENSLYWGGKPYVGPESVVEHVFARIQEDFDGFSIDIQRISGCGNTVLVEARYGGTGKATGKPIDAQVAHVWDVRDGKLTRFQQYVDTWRLAQVTGHTPAG